MNIIEWIFGKNDNREYERIRNRFLSKTQEAVDAYHSQMDTLCGADAKTRCEECYYRDIPKEAEFLYNKCSKYQDRCKLRSHLMIKCKKLEEEAAEELRAAFIECRCCLLRPWYRKHRLELEGK